MAVYILANL